MLKLLLLYIFITVIQYSTAGVLPFTSEKQTSDQLPTLIPLRYDLQIQLPTAAPEDDLIPAFFGTIKIDFQLSRPIFAKYQFYPTVTSFQHQLLFRPNQRPTGAEIRLNALRLSNFENVTLEGNGHSFNITAITVEKDEVVFHVPEPALSQGRYSLSIGRYSGVITYTKGVFYRDAGEHPFLGTDLFPDYAKSLFPCFDNPAAKAVIQLNIIHPKNTIALSSMHSTGPSTELSDSWQLTQFAEAPSLSTFMLSLAILPPEYIRGYAGSKFPIYVWINKLLHPPSIAADFANLTGRIYDEIEQILGSESLQLKEINLIGVNEFNGSQSFGTVFIGMEEWKKSDEMHKVSIIAKSLIRQWIGGLITIASRSEICFQEDLVQYLANKIVYRLFASDHLKIESYRLSEYVKVQMAETFFAPGESLSLSVDASIPQIQSHCALKGVIQLESLESILGEATFLSKITSLISQHKFRTYRIESLLEHLRMHLIDGSINLSQVFEFWRKNGGIPNLFVEKLDEKIRLTQINRNRQSQIGNYLWAPMPLWPLRISIRNLSLPVNFMVSQGLEMAPIDKKILALNNFDFENLYRVNYDQNTWERIHQSMSESPEFFTARSRAQLINDFCYFYSLGEIGDNADKIRRNFLQLIRNEAESFDLCEFYAFWCIAGNKRKISLKKDSRKRIMQFMPKVYSSLSNRENFACFEPPLLGNDTASNTANALCQTVFGSECL